MHRSSHKFLMTVFALLLVLVATEAVAGGSHYYGSRHYGPRLSHTYYGSYSNYGYYYPARGYAAHVLPYGYHTAHWHGSPYYYAGGAWYRPYGARFMVVAPPFGIGVSLLPPFYTTLWYGGSPYYYANDTYYQYHSARREYVVSERPRGEPQAAPEASNSQLYAYPRNGQSEQQQSTDRDDCHRWAVVKTGYDPTRPPGNVAETDMTTSRNNYHRAEGACLDARGYSVK
jgi:hypothetical protein